MSDDFSKLADSTGADCVAEIRQAISASGIGASGRTAASLGYRDTGEQLTIYSDGTGAPIGTLQHGRPGGKVPFGFYGIIRQWAIDKGISFSSDKELNAFAYFVSKKIAAEGTKRHTEPRDDIYTPALKKAETRFRERDIKQLRDITINILLK